MIESDGKVIVQYQIDSIDQLNQLDGQIELHARCKFISMSKLENCCPSGRQIKTNGFAAGFVLPLLINEVRRQPQFSSLVYR